MLKVVPRPALGREFLCSPEGPKWQLPSTQPNLVEIDGLSVRFGETTALSGLSLSLKAGESVGIIGESGSGKSVTWLAALGLLPSSAQVSGSVRLGGEELIGATRQTLEGIRGRRVAMIFQDPTSSLNPTQRIGKQIAESLGLHRALKGAAARIEAKRLLDLVGIPNSGQRIDCFPFELSGGQCQRVSIAIALAGQPDILIADEPTTALDVTIQAQILGLLHSIQRDLGTAIVFVSHDLGVIAEVCSRAYVMQAGRVVEHGIIQELFHHPRHPYTRELLGSLLDMDTDFPVVIESAA